MKMKKLTIALAAASMMTSGIVLAGDHGLKFGGYFITNKTWSDMDADVSTYGLDAGNWVVVERYNQTNESTNKNFDDFNLWMSKKLDENFDLYAEIDADGRTDDVNLEQAWIETDYFGNWLVVRAGQQRINFDGDHTRRRFNDIALGDTSIFATVLGGGLSEGSIFNSSPGNVGTVFGGTNIPSLNLQDNMLGVSLRGTDGNLFYSLGVYDDASSSKTESTDRATVNGTTVPDIESGDFTREISHAVTLRGAYKIGEQDDDFQYQGALAFFTAEGSESENTDITVDAASNNVTLSQSDSEVSSDGFGVELYGTWSAANMVAELTYFDAEIDDESTSATATTVPVTGTASLDNENWEIDGISFLLAWASAGAYQMEAGGAPTLVLPESNGITWEAYLRYWDYSAELSERETSGNLSGPTADNAFTHDNEWDGFAIGGTAYLGQHVSVGFEYGMGDFTFSDTFDQLFPVDTDGPLADTDVDKETDFFELQLQVIF